MMIMMIMTMMLNKTNKKNDDNDPSPTPECALGGFFFIPLSIVVNDECIC